MANFIAQLVHRITRKVARPQGLISLTSIRPFLPPNPVIVEAGAHVGVDTMAMSRFWPNGRIYAFEPVPELFAQLKKKVARRRNVTCFPIALSVAAGTAQMYKSGGASNASSSLLPPTGHLTDHADVTFSTQIEIETTTLDAWAAAYGVHQVDFLWLDVQGLELDVMRSSPGILRTVRAVCTEVYLRQSYSGVPLYAHVTEYLQRQGFVVQLEDLPWPDAGNVLFVRRSSAMPEPLDPNQ